MSFPTLIVRVTAILLSESSTDTLLHSQSSEITAPNYAKSIPWTRTYFPHFSAIFPDFSLTTFKYQVFSTLSKWVKGKRIKEAYSDTC